MLRMPTIHTPPPVRSAGSWQQAATSLDTFGQADHTAPINLTWHSNQTSAVRYFDGAEPAPVQPEPILPPSPFSRMFGFMGTVACTLLLGSFLALSGCKWLDKFVGKKRETEITSTRKVLSDSDLFIGKSRTVRLKPNRKLSRRLLSKLEGQAYRRAKALIKKDVDPRVRSIYPIDCRGRKVAFSMDWNHLSYEVEPVRVLKNGTQIIRIICKVTWNEAWCKRRYSSNRAKGIRGSKIPYRISNPALK